MGRAAKRKRICKACNGMGTILSEPPRRHIQGTSAGIRVLTMTVEHLCPSCTHVRQRLLDGDWYTKPGRLLP